MRLDNEFVVPRPIDEAWAVLTDLERVAPCMPGAQLTEIDGDDYHGTVRVKVGPVVAAYAGVARLLERHSAKHHAVLQATGKERSGRGQASALVTADLVDEGENTRVTVATDLTISGPLAQFGRGAIVEVSQKLLGQFVDRLRETVLEQGTAPPEAAAGPPAATPAPPAPATTTSPAAAPATMAAPVGAAAATVTAPANGAPVAGGRRLINAPEAAPADLVQFAGASILKRAIPALAVLAAVATVVIIWRNRRSGRG